MIGPGASPISRRCRPIRIGAGGRLSTLSARTLAMNHSCASVEKSPVRPRQSARDTRYNRSGSSLRARRRKAPSPTRSLLWQQWPVGPLEPDRGAPRLEEELLELTPDPLRGQVGEIDPAAKLHGGRVDGELEAGGELHGPQDPKAVLHESRRIHRPQDTGPQIVPA